MSQPNKWWWGLIPLALIWVVSNFVLDGRIEEDLSARARTALEGASVHEPSVSVLGRDIALSGTIFSAGQATAAGNAAGAEWGVRRVAADELAPPPPASPFAWRLRLDGETPVLDGAVSDPASRASLLAAVRAAFPDREIRDEATYAGGAPAEFAAVAARGVELIAGLEEPGLSLSDQALSISGRAASVEARDAVLSALEDLPQGYTVAAAEIEAPEPYGFSARLGEGALTLSGGVPDEGLRAGIRDLAGRLFSRARVVDELEVAGDAPEGFAAAVQAGLGALSRLAQGAFSLSGTEAELSGQARYEGALGGIRDGLTGALPEGFVARFDELATQPAGPAIDVAACQLEVNGLLEVATILFETGSARISGDSAGVLDEIVGTFARCADARVEIAGHTDSSGDFEANVALSQQRAEAVLGYLTAAGLPAASFTARGYGPANPVASNDTEEGRARNRRIEFTVQ